MAEPPETPVAAKISRRDFYRANARPIPEPVIECFVAGDASPDALGVRLRSTDPDVTVAAWAEAEVIWADAYAGAMLSKHPEAD